MRFRTILTTTAACAALAVAAPFAPAASAPAVVTSVNGTCTVAKMAGLHGATKVRIKGSNLAEPFLTMTGCDSVYAIVQKASVMQMPFSTAGFDCTPSMVSNRIGKWTCAFKAADTAATISQTFTARYAK